jgi:hypothetical protein
MQTLINQLDRQIPDDILTFPQNADDRTGRIPVGNDDLIDLGPHLSLNVRVLGMIVRSHA